MRREMGGSFKREETHVYLWLIHVDVWQKRTQFCKAIILHLKNELKKLKAKRHWGRTLTSSATGTNFFKKFYLKHLALSHSLSSFHYCFICPINISTEFLLLDQKVSSIFWTFYWHHQLNGHEFEQTQRDSEGQGTLAHAVHGVAESDSTEWLNSDKLRSLKYFNKANGSFFVLLSPKNFLSSLYLVTNDLKIWILWVHLSSTFIIKRKLDQ